MASFGKYQASVTSFNNETTAALINVNLDFSLFRCDTKPEYLPIGSALTSRRREEAETGPIHRTACTLGFLFSDTLPDTPALFKAYGQRVSEILAQPNINPQGTASDGPFQYFVGADCTSIWAAATSGDASIAVHLLACILARAFDSKTATSIWFEIIQERKQQVNKLLKENKMIHPYTIVASKQTIARPELAAWDTSARAWLRRADESKAWEKHQFAIIIENINLPYTAPGTTYSKVMTTWTKSMEVLNNLLVNIPQQASDRAILLAISSWHLHPNLLVFQDKAINVDFKDQLFLASAVLTLGLEYQLQAGDTGIRWSLALSHLRYYGDPVAVRSNEEMSRVTMPQFSLVALGSLLRLWDLRGSNIVEAINWLNALGDMISTASGEDHIEINWIRFFCGAAKSFHDGDQRREEVNLQLVKFGWRRALNLFGRNQGTQQPFFGLLNPYVLRALKEDDPTNRGFAYLRELISSPKFDVSQVLISFTMVVGSDLFSEWATVIAVPTLQLQNNMQHCKWIHFDNTEMLSQQQLDFLEQRQKVIQEMGEPCQIISHPENVPHTSRGRGKSNLRLWPNPPSVLKTKSETSRVFREILLDTREESGQGFSIWVDADTWSDSLTQQVKSRSNTIGTIQDSFSVLKQLKSPQTIVGYLLSIMLPPSNSSRQFLKRKRSSDDINEAQYTTNTVENTGVANRLMARQNQPSRHFLLSVVTLQIATIMYRQLPVATVSLRVVDMELHKASWLPAGFTEERDDDLTYPYWIANESASDWYGQMTRAEAFGCVAMFESGRFNIKEEHLADVLALCTEDSIFVAGIMLRDPSLESPSGPQIRHLVGSIGQAGLVLLVSPLDPRIRPTGYNPLSVQHREYDGKRENKFDSVSLHLSFTEWKMPLDWASTGEIDNEVFLLESVLSVMDGGQWIGDIDVLEIEKAPLEVFETDCKGDCDGSETGGYAQKMERISLDTWEELLDAPPAVGIFRARTNWAARLAAASILSQQSKAHATVVVGGTELCWKCLVSHYMYPELHLPQIIID
ncbi:hypothetical protein E0Z10_g9135 [Xylaria hypoxylon]|uniref:Uncharacterized protein n=1 Tax=Xylaria hypoxylon TaxID=37992 RepID=A0A4Z0YK78_9PEZI|nr:hypothetical protein E0Z10_g9135 [Xylaria hypoxylon]